MRDLTRIGRTGIIPAITWKAFEGKSDQLGVIARLQGVLFVKRDAQGATPSADSLNHLAADLGVSFDTFRSADAIVRSALSALQSHRLKVLVRINGGRITAR
jgi:hypothetical protein